MKIYTEQDLPMPVLHDKHQTYDANTSVRTWFQKLQEEVIRKNKGKKPVILPVKQRSRWQSGICKICGEYFDCITNEHAHRHGFPNADAMAKSDVVDFGKRVRR